MVALERGAKMGWPTWIEGGPHGDDDESRRRLGEALRDVSIWLGFHGFDDEKHEENDYVSYVNTLPKEGADIFKRATS